MTYQEVLTQEIATLPPVLLQEALDFILFLKIKARTADEPLTVRMKEAQFQQELEALSQAYRMRLAQEGKLEQSTEDVIAALKLTREKIAAHEYQR